MSNPRWDRARASAGRAAARARELNRNPGAVDAVRRVRRLLPGDSGFGDPLSAAGRDGAGTVARLAGRLFDEQPTASREITLSGLQLWHSLRERAGRAGGVGEVTVVFTDLVGFSDWAMRAGDEDALRLLRGVASALEPQVGAHRGQVVKRLGDGMMAVFPSPRLAWAATTSFTAALEAVEVESVEVAGWRPRLRVGIHTGRPRPIGGDYLGMDVNIAARLAEKAGAGEVLLTEATLAGLDAAEVTARRKGFGLRRPKGIPDELTVYSVRPSGRGVPTGR